MHVIIKSQGRDTFSVTTGATLVRNAKKCAPTCEVITDRNDKEQLYLLFFT